MKTSILVRLMIILLVFSIVPIAILGYWVYSDITKLNTQTKETITALGTTTLSDSTSALNTLGEDIIKQRAESVAKEIEIYLKSNPSATVADLQNDPYFNTIAVQPVGKTGYTAITDVETLVCRFHANPAIVNTDLHNLATKLPGFWSVMQKSQGGIISSGYYDWLEKDNSTKQKYMYIAIVNAKTADNITFSVAATTYIEEFSSPVVAISEKITVAQQETTRTLDSATRNILTLTLLVILILAIIVSIVGYLVARSISKPIVALKNTADKITSGEEVVVPHDNKITEIEELSASMEMLKEALHLHQEQKKKE